MPLFLLSILAAGKSIAQGIVHWLSRRSLAEIGCIILCIVCGVQTLRLASEQRHSAKLELQIRKSAQALEAERAAIKRKDAELADKSAQLRKANDEENSRIHGDAGAVRVSGPGRAACHPSTPAPASGPQAPAAKPDAAGPALPPADGADVSWGWLTDRAEEHDQLRAEVQTWRDWYAEMVRNWPARDNHK